MADDKWIKTGELQGGLRGGRGARGPGKAASYLGLRGSVVLSHQLWRVELRDGFEGVQSHQGAASVGVERVRHVPGLQTPQD